MSLREFLSDMERKGDVLHVEDELSPRFEVSAVIKEFDGGPILYFHRVSGHDIPVVAGVCANRERLCEALGVDMQTLYTRLLDACDNPLEPRVISEAPVMEVSENPELGRLPILTHYEGDAGPYITSAIVSARSPDGEIENVSIHRLQLLDDRHLAIRIVPRHLHQLWLMAKERGEDLDVAISIGLHPAVSIAASSPAPFGVSEYGVANRLLGGRLTLVECEEVDARAPAEAEFVLEARISTSRLVDEGPLVDATGTHDIVRKQPLVEVLRVHRRSSPIYQALLPGGREHWLLMGLPKEAMIWKAVRHVAPGVKAVYLTPGGCGWLHAVISLEKQTEGDAKNALLAAFAAHPSLKHAVAVDADINIYDPREVEWAIATRFQADEDLIVVRGARGSTLDPSADQETGTTTKLAIDATRPLTKPEHHFKRARIPKTERASQIIAKLSSLKRK